MTTARTRTVAVVTGIRSEYDILHGVMTAIARHPDLQLEVVVTGAHLSPGFGSTFRQIEADGYPVVACIESLLSSDSLSGRVKSAGIQLMGLADHFKRQRPDMILVVGDREESITSALVGAYMNIPVAHLAGGDLVVGNVDDSVRHAVTKLAHLHFPFSEESAARIRRMGEEPWRVHRIGNPALDRFRLIEPLTRAELGQRLGMVLGEGPLLVVIQHVISSEHERGEAQMEVTMEAVVALGHTTLVGYPNTDAGSQGIIRVIDRYMEEHCFITGYKNLPRREFVSLLRHASVLVGNSSLGILEAPYLKLPAVNIGNRQRRRQHGANVIFVPHEREAIVQAVDRALNDAGFLDRVQRADNPFGDGHAGERIAEVLATVELGERLATKDWVL